MFVDTNGGQHQFGNIRSGQASEYKLFESAYRYSFIELKIDGEIYTLQPIDYVGETFLDPGKYNHTINATEAEDRHGRLSMELLADD